MSAREFGTHFSRQQRGVGAADPNRVSFIKKRANQAFPRFHLLNFVEENRRRCRADRLHTFDKTGKVIGSEPEEAGIFEIAKNAPAKRLI